MINNLSICILIKNNSISIKDCIESIKDLTKDIIFVDMGSFDNTKDIINNYEYKIHPRISELNKDNKNNLIKLAKNEWLFFIEPNEIIINGKNEIQKLLIDKSNVYSALILNNNILSKSVRIFNKNKNIIFENPIYENLYCDSIKTGIVLKEISNNNQSTQEEYKNIINWKNNEKLNPSPIYYECLYYIKNKEYDKFFTTAEKYLFLEKNYNLPSYLMIKYYLSLLYFYTKKDFSNSVKNITFCLEKNPTMAEFWCLLGDINFELKKYKKAYYFYDNAIIIGKHRSNEDDLPIDIIKYKEYPEKMKNICKELVNNI